MPSSARAAASHRAQFSRCSAIASSASSESSPRLKAASSSGVRQVLRPMPLSWQANVPMRCCVSRTRRFARVIRPPYNVPNDLYTFCQRQARHPDEACSWRVQGASRAEPAPHSIASDVTRLLPGVEMGIAERPQPDPAGAKQETSLTLLQRLRDRRVDAWQAMVQLYSPLVYYWCTRGGVRGPDVEDVSQEVFRAA